LTVLEDLRETLLHPRFHVPAHLSFEWLFLIVTFSRPESVSEPLIAQTRSCWQYQKAVLASHTDPAGLRLVVGDVLDRGELLFSELQGSSMLCTELRLLWSNVGERSCKVSDSYAGTAAAFHRHILCKLIPYQNAR